MRKLFIVILSSIVSVSLWAQYEEISGQINEYYKVTDVYEDSVKLQIGTDLSTLSPGDKVVLMQMTGIDVDDSNIEANINGIIGPENAGKYELLAVAPIFGKQR